MTVQSFAQINALKIGPKKKYGIQLMTGPKTYHSLLEFFLQLFTGALEHNSYSQKIFCTKNS